MYAPIIARLHDAGFSVRCSLTGGRDSRAIAALVSSVIDQPRFHFGGPVGGAESLIAERVAATIGGSFELHSGANNPTAKDYDKAERHFLSRSCGTLVLDNLRSASLAEPDFNHPREVYITGHAGEIARWSLESVLGVFATPSVVASRRHMNNRMVSTGSGLFLPDVLSTIRTHINALIESALALGVKRHNIQSVVARDLRDSRWTAGQIARSFRRNDVLAPFPTHPLMKIAPRMRPRDRFSEAFHRALIHRCAPAALDVPYFKHSGTGQRLRNELAREVMLRVRPIERHYRRRKGPGRQARWEPWLRPILRERLLDHPTDSPAWEHISRPELERILTDDTGDLFRTRVYPLLRAATVIRFWELYRTGL